MSAAAVHQTLTVPMLLLHGAEDQIVTLAGTALHMLVCVCVCVCVRVCVCVCV
jgi:type IV secretory pathway TrbD component